MAWPASQVTLENAFDDTNTKAVNLRAELNALIISSAAGSVARNTVRKAWKNLAEAVTAWNAAAALTGMEAYARDQFENQSLDVAAEFTAMLNTATALESWIDTNFPRSNGALLVYSDDGDGNLTDLLFTTADLATFRTNAQALIDTIG